MNTLEKHSENLCLKESELIAFCGEVVRWTLLNPDIRWFEKSQLRKMAADIFRTLEKIDFCYHDGYYRLCRKVDELRRYYIEVQELEKTSDVKGVDFMRTGMAALIEDIMSSIDELGSFKGLTTFVTPHTKRVDTYTYGDYLRMDIIAGEDGSFTIHVNELWDFSLFEEDIFVEYLQEVLKSRFDFEIRKKGRLHDYANAYEFNLDVVNIPKDQLKDVLSFMITTIKANPRRRKVD